MPKQINTKGKEKSSKGHSSDYLQDQSTGWSEWILDPATHKYYRSKLDAKGNRLWEWDNNKIPRTTPDNSSAEASQNSEEYSQNNDYDYQNSVSYVSNTLVGTSMTGQAESYQQSSSRLDYQQGRQYQPGKGAREGGGTVTPYNNRVIKPPRTHSKSHEKLDSDFKVHHSKEFKPGYVIKVFWSEPMGETFSSTTIVTEGEHETRYGKKVYTSIRRFIIVNSGTGCSNCVPILTYQHQATKKSGVNRDSHAIIYIGKNPPDLLEGEEFLTNFPIQMDPKTPREKLDTASRINYAKYYSVEHNVRVMFIGKISDHCFNSFLMSADKVWANMSK